MSGALGVATKKAPPGRRSGARRQSFVHEHQKRGMGCIGSKRVAFTPAAPPTRRIGWDGIQKTELCAKHKKLRMVRIRNNNKRCTRPVYY